MHLRVKVSECALCNLCSLACAFKHSGTLSLARAAIRVSPELPDSLKVKMNFCIQCPQGYCIESCPQKALRREEDGRVTMEELLCDACQGEYRCVSACKVNGIFKSSDGARPVKCDLCGGDPECAGVCPNELISVA